MSEEDSAGILLVYYRMVDYSRILIEFFHDNNTIISSDRLNIVYREYYSLMHSSL